MVMYKNMVGFSNVTGNMVLTEHSVVTSYKRLFEVDVGYNKQKILRYFNKAQL